jgi:hypothetical protein
MSTALWWGGFATEWELFNKVTFDGELKLIIVNPGVANLSIKGDVYSAWKRWVQTYDYSKYDAAVRTIGGDPLGDNLYAGDIYFLINDWRLVVDLTQVRITGALYSDDYETAFWAYEQTTNNIIPQYPATVSQLVQTVEVTMPVVTGDANTIPAKVWDELKSSHILPGTFGKAVQDLPTANQNADAVWSKPTSTMTDKSTIGGFIVKLMLTVPKYLGLK